MREPSRQAVAEGRGENERIEFCARCHGAPGGTAGASRVQGEGAREMRGVNGVVNGVNGHLTDSDEDEDEDAAMDGSDDELERELRAYIPASYRGVSMQPNGDLTQQASASSSINPLSEQAQLAQARRDQSEQASERIGQLLLQGYSLLSTLCSNSTCYAIPLVGHPRARGAGRVEGQKKECVVCGKMWDADGSVVRESRGAGTRPAVRGAETEPTSQLVSAGPAQAGAEATGRTTIRDISREEAMRIYSGESPASIAAATTRDTSTPNVMSAPSPQTGTSQQTSISTSSTTSFAQALDRSERNLINTLNRINEILERKTPADDAEFQRFVGRTEEGLGGYLEAMTRVVDAIETVRGARSSP